MKCLFFPRESDRRAVPRFSLQGRLRVVPHDNEACALMTTRLRTKIKSVMKVSQKWARRHCVTAYLAAAAILRLSTLNSLPRRTSFDGALK